MRILMIVACLLVLAVSASADLVGTTPPASVIVTEGQYQWIWAAPCANSDPSCGNQPLTLHDGFRVATDAEWQASFTSYTDVYNAFNPVGGGPICGSPYFDSGWINCDPGDVAIGAIWNSPFTNHDYDWAASQFDTFLVRDAVPEPASLLLLGSGLLGLGGSIRRKLKT